MDMCFRCGKTEKEVRLLEAIYENEIVKICPRCSIIEDIPIIKKPSTSQLKDAERNYTVYQRLNKIAGIEDKEEPITSFEEEFKKLDQNPQLEEPEEKPPFNLIENFHWHVQRARRNKGLSHQQLGWALGESETALKMIEKGNLPDDPEKIIKKLEQFFRIQIKDRTNEELEQEKKEKYKIPQVESADLKEPKQVEPLVLESEIINNEAVSIKQENRPIGETEEETGQQEEKSPAKILSFKPEALENITIADLQSLKQEKEREERLIAVEKEREETLKAESLIAKTQDEEEKKELLRQTIAREMKDIAMGKKEEKFKQEAEPISEKKDMLNQAVQKISMTPEERQKADEEKKKEEDAVPTISELVEGKKKQADEEKRVIGDEIDIIEEQEKEASDGPGAEELLREEE